MHNIGFPGMAFAVTSLPSITPPSALKHAWHTQNHVTQYDLTNCTLLLS
jgi:hypothetical protein